LTVTVLQWPQALQRSALAEGQMPLAPHLLCTVQHTRAKEIECD
jgi:hypothetical protein